MALLTTFVSIALLTISVFGTNEPIIGLLTIPCVSEPWYCPDNATDHNATDHNATSFFYASYVKWLEAGGARVVPIQADMDHKRVRTLLSQLNGVLFTGGAASFNISTSIYMQQVGNIMDYLLQYSNTNKGKAIPLWATCLGFESITVYIANDLSVQSSGYNSEDVPLPIKFTEMAPNSTMFNSKEMDQGYVQSVYNKLATENVTSNWHQDGFDPSVWETNEYLKGNMTLLGTSQDLDGKWFGALQQSKNNGEPNTFQYIYASQFHPEKPQFVFDADNGTNNIPHSIDAIYVNQYFVEFFINEARIRNDNKMDQELYQQSVIYNYVPDWYDDGQTHPEQLYWFPDPN